MVAAARTRQIKQADAQAGYVEQITTPTKERCKTTTTTVNSPHYTGFLIATYTTEGPKESMLGSWLDRMSSHNVGGYHRPPARQSTLSDITSAYSSR